MFVIKALTLSRNFVTRFFCNFYSQTLVKNIPHKSYDLVYQTTSESDQSEIKWETQGHNVLVTLKRIFFQNTITHKLVSNKNYFQSEYLNVNFSI